MKIKYIIDYKGYGNLYQLTNTRTGECLDITREQAQDYKLSTTFFSVRAEVSLNSVEQVEVKRSLASALGGTYAEELPSQRPVTRNARIDW